VARATTTTTGSDDPFEAVSDFFESSTWDLIVTLLWVAAIALWLALAVWTFQDARRRIRQPALVAACTLLGLVPFVGPLVYMFLRPPEYLADARERELEVIALEQRIDGLRCPDCDFPIESRFVACPSCLRKLKDPCVRCQEPLDPTWRICPYCETAVSPAFSPLHAERERERDRDRMAATAQDPDPDPLPQ
jgi:hypothetical protein